MTNKTNEKHDALHPEYVRFSTSDGIEKAARAMALHAGWEKWDSATSFCDTPGGNDPEDERQYWLDLAAISISAIANKAAEEGELPALPDPDHSLDGGKLPFWNEDDMRSYARAAIAADRAARPVACLNEDQKWLIECAEMASSGSYPDLAGKIRTACKATVSVDRPVANKAEVEKLLNTAAKESIHCAELMGPNTKMRVERMFSELRAALAAPPATTGASTAIPAEVAAALGLSESASIEDAVKSIRTVQRNAFLAPVGASTVLTDERKRVMFEEWATKQGGYDLRPYNWRLKSIGGLPYTGYVRPYKQDRTVHAFEGFVAALGEVAAQAGQVAVPGWISVDDRLPENGKDVIILYWPYDNHENERVAGTAHHVEGTFYDEDGNDMHPPSHWMPFVTPEAAPSPAKESK